MSNSRKTQAKYQNAAFFRYQQKKLHAAQKRARILEVNNTEFKFTPGPINTGNIMFWIFFLSFIQYACSVTQRSSSQAIIDSKVRDLAVARTTIFEGIDAGIYSVVADKFGALAAVNSDFRENALNVLSQPNFELVCTNLESLKIYLKGQKVTALYNRKYNALMVALDALHDSTLSHEILHARMAQLHNSDSNCHIENDDQHGVQTVPIYPVTDENVKVFEACMTKGDNRIKELHRILTKSRNKIILSQDEKFQLGRAKNALKGVILDVGIFGASKGLLESLHKVGWPAKDALIIENEAYVSILNITENEDELVIHGKADTGIDAAIYGINSFFKLNINGFKNKEIEISERIAYSLQQLDRQARHFLYPELSKLLVQEQEKCTRVARNEL